MNRRILVIMLLLSLISPPAITSAHSGRTDSSGGHNCSSASKAKGLCSGYHYHNGGSSSSGSSSSSSSTSGASSPVSKPSSPQASEAKSQENTVKVSFTSFQVHVNEQNVDNTYSQYPLFVYKDITYFPMTWNYTQALGLRTSWNADTGFAVSKDDSIPYADKLNIDNGSYVSPGSTVTATFPSFNVFVNDTWVDNSKEEHPILVYKDITYFPMTWRFAVEELGLITNWSETDGFSITRPKK
ncbi:YHYH domain-containing protein [Paenibacillus mesotrionivorans]|uniref:YHYH domain-containing protein n=1 Tax=Paenibacillus mesotrionivorans TaxID=3160968 RepID=A0ACC7P417_9BACL